MANLEARTDPKQLKEEPTRTVAGLFGITQEPWHRKKVFDKSPASFARLAHRIIWYRAWYRPTAPMSSPRSRRGTRLIVPALGRTSALTAESERKWRIALHSSHQAQIDVAPT